MQWVSTAWNKGQIKNAKKSLGGTKNHPPGERVMLKVKHEKTATKITSRRTVVIHNRSRTSERKLNFVWWNTAGGESLPCIGSGRECKAECKTQRARAGI